MYCSGVSRAYSVHASLRVSASHILLGSAPMATNDATIALSPIKGSANTLRSEAASITITGQHFCGPIVLMEVVVENSEEVLSRVP